MINSILLFVSISVWIIFLSIIGVPILRLSGSSITKDISKKLITSLIPTIRTILLLLTISHHTAIHITILASHHLVHHHWVHHHRVHHRHLIHHHHLQLHHLNRIEPLTSLLLLLVASKWTLILIKHMHRRRDTHKPVLIAFFFQYRDLVL